MKRPISTQQISKPVIAVVVAVVVLVLLLVGRSRLSNRMPEVPPEMKDRDLSKPAGGMMKGGGMSKMGQPRRGITPGKAPD